MLQSNDITASGASASGNLYTFILRLTQLSADVVKNTSKLRIQAILTQSITGTGFSSWGTGVSCRLNGNEIFSDYVQRRISGTKEHIFYTWEGEVAHSEDGTLNLQVEGRLWQNASASYTPPELTAQGQLELQPIARASTVNASSGNIGQAVMVAVAKKNDRFTHTLEYRFGELRGFVDTDGKASDQQVMLSASACAFCLPESFYNQIPEESSGQCELICTTYDGDVQIGAPQSCSFTVTAEKSLCQPVIAGEVKDINPATVELTGDENILIRYASTALCTAHAQAKNGAALKSVQIAGIEPIKDGIVEIEQTESGVFLFSAADTRGYETVVPVEQPLIPYVKLTCNPQPGRTDPGTGVAKVRLEGSCYQGNFGAAENTLTLRYAFAGADVTEITLQPAEDHTYACELEIPGLDYTQSYELLLQVEDQIAIVDTTVRIGQAIPVFDWGKDYFRFNVPMTALSVNDRGQCNDADAAVAPGVYRLTSSQPVGEGLLLVFASGGVTAQLAIGASGRKARLITEDIVQDWTDW